MQLLCRHNENGKQKSLPNCQTSNMSQHISR